MGPTSRGFYHLSALLLQPETLAEYPQRRGAYTMHTPRGRSSVWQSTWFATRGSSVRIRSSPPLRSSRFTSYVRAEPRRHRKLIVIPVYLGSPCRRRTVGNAVIVDAIRTPGGKRGGKLKGWHPVDLAAEVLREIVTRNNVDPGAVDDVIMGCVSQTGEQSVNIGRNALLAAGFPEHVPGVTIDRQCGSSQQAVHFAAQGVIAGVYDIVIAAGVESMTRVPMGITMQQGPGVPFGPRMSARYRERAGAAGYLRRADCRAVGDHPRGDRQARTRLPSPCRSEPPTRAGSRKRSFPIEVRLDNGATEMMTTDEGIRPDTTLEVLAGLRTVFKDDGVVTAGNSSQISDGAAAVLVMSEEKAAELGLAPRARFKAFAVVGVDPIIDAHRPDPGHREGARKRRAHHRRHRPVRGQRGVRHRDRRLAAGDRRRLGEDERQRRGHCAGPSRSVPPAPS